MLRPYMGLKLNIIVMKKNLSLAFLLCVCAGIHAEDKTLCTIVTSPCKEVANILIPGKATDKQIRDAQEELRIKCAQMQQRKDHLTAEPAGSAV